MTDFSTHVIPTEAASLPRVVLADANVFFSPRLRDLFMTLHAHDLLVLRWTRKIEEEWTRNVIKKHAGATAALRACVLGMRKAVPDWEVVCNDGLEWAFRDVDANDRHVAAAAYQLATKGVPEGCLVALVTSNLRDFASTLLARKKVLVMSPGTYLDRLLEQHPRSILAVADECRLKLKQPPLAVLQYVNALRNVGCLALPMALLRRAGLPAEGMQEEASLATELK